MIVNLPDGLETLLETMVESGRYPSTDAAITAAVYFLMRHDPPVLRPMTEEAFAQYMLATGMVSRLPDRANAYDDPDDQPIEIEGEPISETIIRERR